MYKIMIIEDDLVMAEAIAKEMNAWGNEAVYVKNCLLYTSDAADD